MEYNSNKFRFISLVVVLSFLVVPMTNVFAITSTSCDPGSILNSDGSLNPGCMPNGVIVSPIQGPAPAGGGAEFYSLSNIIPVLLNKNVLPFLALLSVIMLVYAGFRLSTSLGEEKGFSDAKEAVQHIVIGFLVAVFSYAIIVALVRLIFERSSYTN